MKSILKRIMHLIFSITVYTDNIAMTFLNQLTLKLKSILEQMLTRICLCSKLFDENEN